MKEELRKLYGEYNEALDKAEVWTHESIEGFIRWILTDEV